MNTEDMRRVWQERSEVAFREVTQWREEHPKATLAQIEQIIDAKIMALRAVMIQETALASPTRVPSVARSRGAGCDLAARIFDLFAW